MPFVLEDFVDRYTCVDPSRGKDCSSHLSKNIFLQGFAIGKDKQLLAEQSKEVQNFDRDQPHAQSLYHQLIEKENKTAKTVQDESKVFDYMQMRDGFDPIRHPNILLNPSSGESISHVAPASQDIVLISHVLDKDTANYFGILAEASRVLKPGGEILIVEDKDKEMLAILEKLRMPW